MFGELEQTIYEIKHEFEELNNKIYDLFFEARIFNCITKLKIDALCEGNLTEKQWKELKKIEAISNKMVNQKELTDSEKEIAKKFGLTNCTNT